MGIYTVQDEEAIKQKPIHKIDCVSFSLNMQHIVRPTVTYFTIKLKEIKVYE